MDGIPDELKDLLMSLMGINKKADATPIQIGTSHMTPDEIRAFDTLDRLGTRLKALQSEFKAGYSEYEAMKTLNWNQVARRLGYRDNNNAIEKNVCLLYDDTDLVFIIHRLSQDEPTTLPTESQWTPTP